MERNTLKGLNLIKPHIEWNFVKCKNISFWYDTWLLDTPLFYLLLKLYKTIFAEQKSILSSISTPIIGTLILSISFYSLISLTNFTLILDPSSEDYYIWSVNPSRQVPYKFLYTHLTNTSIHPTPDYHILQKLPFKLFYSLWLCLHNSLPTAHTLFSRHHSPWSMCHFDTQIPAENMNKKLHHPRPTKQFSLIH